MTADRIKWFFSRLWLTDICDVLLLDIYFILLNFLHPLTAWQPKVLGDVNKVSDPGNLTPDYFAAAHNSQNRLTSTQCKKKKQKKKTDQNITPPKKRDLAFWNASVTFIWKSKNIQHFPRVSTINTLG